jgi:hypothetical protein
MESNDLIAHINKNKGNFFAIFKIQVASIDVAEVRRLYRALAIKVHP